MTPKTPAHQIHTGPIYADNCVDRNLALIAGQNPATVARMRKRYGRYLSGLGGTSMSGAVGYDSVYQEQHTYGLEEQDDVYGSGVFDQKGRPGTSDVNMGVFTSHYSLPGFIAREVPFAVSKDVYDITDDADVVVVPGGGMSYIESEGRNVAPARLGPAMPPPMISPAAVASNQDVYAYLTEGGPPPLSPAKRVPWSPAESSVPFDYPEQILPTQSDVNPFKHSLPVGPQPANVQSRVVGNRSGIFGPYQGDGTVLPTQSIVNPMGAYSRAMVRRPSKGRRMSRPGTAGRSVLKAMRGFGAITDSNVALGAMGIAGGLLFGAIFFALTNKK